MFLLPGLIITWYVTNTPIPETYATEIKSYLFHRQHPEQGGWGLHIEGESTVFGTSLNYTILRLLGVSEEDPRMVTARATLHKLGGAVKGPHWAKFWLSVLGAADWEIVNPVPPELWLLPDWAPIAPWRWWIHMRQVFLPMSYIWSKRFVHPLTDLVKKIREEIYVQPYDSINWASHRNSISPLDNYHPKTFILNGINWMLVNVWNPYIRPNGLRDKAEAWAWELIKREDENTDFANLGPVNGPMNLLACYLTLGEGSYEVRRHRERMNDFLWMKSEGMLMNGTNGVQTWDTSFAVLAIHEAGLGGDRKWRNVLLKAHQFLEAQQMTEEIKELDVCYRQRRKGAWAFSNSAQGYTVSDTTSEGLKATILLQNVHGFPAIISDDRLHDAIDTLLTMQNSTGGFASYEPTRGSELLEWLNAAEVFGRIMIEYDYPECTSAVITALTLFKTHYPTYRSVEIQSSLDRALRYIRAAQRPDGSWYGSWGICFTYAAMFALEALATVDESYANSAHVRKGCDYLVQHQREDGGWGESYRACETGVWHDHAQTQVVQTSWAVIALLHGQYPDKDVLRRGLALIVQRQQSDGSWDQEAIEGVFNKSW
jgi:lanosterol synthase